MIIKEQITSVLVYANTGEDLFIDNDNTSNETRSIINYGTMLYSNELVHFLKVKHTNLYNVSRIFIDKKADYNFKYRLK